MKIEEKIISSIKVLADKRSQIKFLSKELNEHSYFNKQLIPQFFDKIFERKFAAISDPLGSSQGKPNLIFFS
jgi:hypothetical protein